MKAQPNPIVPPALPMKEAFPSQWELHHDYTTSQLGLHQLLQEWRAEMDVYSREPGRYRCDGIARNMLHNTVDTMELYYRTHTVQLQGINMLHHTVDTMSL